MNRSALLANYQERSGEQVNDINALVARALLHVVHQHILPVAPSLVVTMSCQLACLFYNDMLARLFGMWGNAPIQMVNIERHRRNEPSEAKGRSGGVAGLRYNNLILTDSYENFRAIDIVKHTRDYNTNEFYHIFLQERDHLLPKAMQRIFAYCWRHQLINCNVQVQTAPGEILFYTYYPYAATHCDRVQPVLVNRYNGTHLERPQLFPRKLRNLHGCKLRAALWHAPPHIYLRTDAEGRQQVAGGFEGNLLLEMARQMNFSVDVRVPLNNEQRGFVSSGNASGALGMLQRHEVELSMGLFVTTIQRVYSFSSTTPHYHSHAVVVLLESAYEMNSVDIFLYVLPQSVWLAMGVLLLLALALGWSMDRKFAPIVEALHVLLALVGQPVNLATQSAAKHLFYIGLMLFTLVVRGIHQGLLFHLVRTHRLTYMPTTLEELALAKYTNIVKTSAFESLMSIPIIARMRYLVVAGVTESVTLEKLVALGTKGYAVITAKDTLRYFGRDHTVAFKALPEEVTSLLLSILLSKHSFLIEEFNLQILRMLSMGLVLAEERAEFGGSKAARNQREYGDKLFGFLELDVIFLLLIVGLTTAVFVFLLELCSARSKRLQALLSALH